MKLDELLGVKRIKDLPKSSLVRFLDEYTPYKNAGSGHFANVFEKDGVIYKFWIMDPAYDKFIEYVEKHKDNPHLPKFLSRRKQLTAFHRRHKDHPKKINYIKIEKLGKNSKLPGGFLQDLTWAIRETYRNGEKDREEQLIKAWERKPELASFIKTVFDVMDFLTKNVHDFYWDLKIDNILSRGPVPVLTDPGIDETTTRQLELLRDLEVIRTDQHVSGRIGKKDDEI